MTVSITTVETDALNELRHTTHVEVPAGEAGPIHGARAVAVEAETRAHLTKLLEDAAIYAAQTRSQMRNVTFEFLIG